jgi:hypothetical protein
MSQDLTPETVTRVNAACSAFMALQPLEQRVFADRLTAVMTAGEPLPALTTIGAEAENWTALASTAELKIYAAAIWHRLSEAERSAFRAWADQRRAVARRCQPYSLIKQCISCLASSRRLSSAATHGWPTLPGACSGRPNAGRGGLARQARQATGAEAGQARLFIAVGRTAQPVPMPGTRADGETGVPVQNFRCTAELAR